MKRIFSFLAACIAYTGMMAQTSVVATLTHEGQTTEFYGPDGLVNAVKASTDGDLVTLSGGHFNGTTINKSLNIRGNGVAGDSVTYIDTEVILEKSANEANRFLNIEGISFSKKVNIQTTKSATELNVIENVTIKKCDLTDFGSKEWYPNNVYYGTTKNMNFIQCRIMNSSTIYNTSEVSYINCIVKGHSFGAGTNAQTNNPKINVINSVILFKGSADCAPWIQARNSILLLNISKTDYDKYYKIPSSASMTNCIVTGNLNNNSVASQMFTNCSGSGSIWMNIGDVFANLTSYNYDSSTIFDDYSLTNSAKEVKGTDGTERGVFGGAAPYSNIVSYPRFTTFEVAEKVVDGVLNVNVVVE